MIFDIDYIQNLYAMLEPCKEVMGHDEWHPEGSVYTHSFQVLHHALRETDSTDLIIAALMHDVGKSVHKLGHDKESAILIEPFASHKTYWLVRQHMRFWDMVDGKMRRVGKVKDLLDHPFLPELVALARWDKMGRVKGFDAYREPQDLVDILNDKAEKHFAREVS